MNGIRKRVEKTGITLNNLKNSGALYIISPALTVFIIMIFFYSIKQYAPFGNNSFAWIDGTIQYLDFHAFLKDVMSGENNIAYSFSKTLGGNMIAVFTYYLTSPLTLLILLCPKRDLNSYFDLALALKIALAALTCNYFLIKRFNEYLDANYKKVWICILSIGYAFCQYDFALSNNIMWIDGVYMLPLMLLEIYNVVYRKVYWRLSVVAGLAILFNWYTGAMNCIFTVFWLLLETMLYAVDNKESGKRLMSTVLDRVVLYAIAMVFAVLIGALVLLPTMWALQSSSRGDLEFGSLKDLSLLNGIYSFVKNYYLGKEGSLEGG